MDAGMKTRIARNRIVGFICLGLALLNVTVVVLAMVDNEKWSRGNLAIAATMVLIGTVNLHRARRLEGEQNTPPDA